MKKNILLLFAFLCQVLGVAAEDRVYISDFSIKAGETKRIELCFDTEATDVKNVQGTITMPAGLTIIDQGSNNWMTPNADRGAGMAQMNTATGKVTVTGFGGTITAGTGAIAYINVMADANLAETSTITLSGFTAKYGSSSNNISSTNCTVTREAGEGGGEGGGQEQSNELTFAFNPASLELIKGQVTTVDVTLTNGMNLTGMQATLAASSGLTITGVTKGSRMVGTFNYNSEKGTIVTLGSISGNEGTVFTVTLKVDDNFTGSATLTLGGLKVTTAAAASISADDITLPVSVIGPAVLTMSQNKVALAAGESASVDVAITNSIALSMIQATLVLPENVTATLTNKINESFLTYNTDNGLILYMGGLMGQPIPAGSNTRLFTLTLTATEDFAAPGEVKLTNITTTTSTAQSIGVPDAVLPVELVVTLADNVDNSSVLETLDGKTCNVTLQRTLTGGMWNTLAAPFTVSEESLTALNEKLALLGGTLAVKKLVNSAISGETLTLTFEDATKIEAGKPYFVKVSQDVNLANLPFDGVVLSKTTVPTVAGDVTFVPTLGLTEVTGTPESILFLKANNTLVNPTSLPDNMNGFRAYFQLNSAAPVRAFNLNMGDDTTGISEMENGKSVEEGIYDLQGRRMDASIQKRGLYIVNGKKVIIK